MKERAEAPFSIWQVEFWLCLLLTILGYIPGIIYALYAIVFVDRDQYFDEYRRPLYAPAWSLSLSLFAAVILILSSSFLFVLSLKPWYSNSI